MVAKPMPRAAQVFDNAGTSQAAAERYGKGAVR